MDDGVLLRTEGLCRNFGSLAAVQDVTLTVRTGELRSIIGPNGAGKTTLFRLISGEMPPSSGRIQFKGREIAGLPQHTVARLGIAKSYQITNIFPHLSVLENVRVAAQGYAHAFDFWSRANRLNAAWERARVVLDLVGLGDKTERVAAFLSHGEKRHLEMAIALAPEPTLLLLDEPTAGMSPEETDSTMVLIRGLAKGRTILVVEHKMKLVMGISDRITVLHQGQILAEGTPEEIRNSQLVQKTYLGAGR